MPRRMDSPEYREYNRIYQNKWYHKNKEKCLKTRKKRFNKLRDQVRKYKISRGCSRCPENFYACLEFHHPDPSLKEWNPQNLIAQKGWSFEKTKKALDELVVLCSNCHRKEHARVVGVVA